MTPIRIGLVFNYDLHYCRCVLRGIKQYSLSKPHWVFLSTLARPPAVTALRGLRLDGLIAQVWTHELARALSRLDCPVVNVSRALNDLSFPRVGVEEAEVGRLAAQHFLERGSRHFAFVGHPEYHYSVSREAGFRETLAKAGYSAACYQVSPESLLASRRRP